MFKKLITLSFLFTTFYNLTFSQDYVLDKRKKIEKKMDKWLAESNRKFNKELTDTTLKYFINDTISAFFGYNFYFDRFNICKVEERTFNCDSCLQKHVKYVLSIKKFHWKQIEGGYKAIFPYSIYMQVLANNNEYKIRYTYRGWKAKNRMLDDED